MAKKAPRKKYLRLERVYAENGLVCTMDDKGTIVKHELKDAAEKARALNSMPIPKELRDTRKRRDDLVEDIINAIQEAKRQRQDPSSKAENYITKLLQNKNEKGELIVPTEENNIALYSLKYFTLTEEEISAVLRQIDRADYREVLMSQKHQERLTQPEYQDKLMDMHR